MGVFTSSMNESVGHGLDSLHHHLLPRHRWTRCAVRSALPRSRAAAAPSPGWRHLCALPAAADPAHYCPTPVTFIQRFKLQLANLIWCHAVFVMVYDTWSRKWQVSLTADPTCLPMTQLEAASCYCILETFGEPPKAHWSFRQSVTAHLHITHFSCVCIP